jgi:hypothetical protein
VTRELPLSILRRLNRSLVYSTVDSVVATSITVDSVDTVFDDVLRAVRAAASIVSAVQETEASSSHGSLKKHGILDLTFRVTAASQAWPVAGIGVLRSLGLVDFTDMSPPDWDHHFLAEFTNDAEACALYLKVFLRTPERIPVRESVRRLRDGLPSDFWPHNFVVEDACLTNVKSIWIAKHVYV